MQALWDWAFASDATVVAENDDRILIVPGDKVKVFSVRHKTWFDDGVVVATFRNGIRVEYGSDTYFGFSLSRGNTKFVDSSEIAKMIIIKGAKRSVSRKKTQALFPGS